MPSPHPETLNPHQMSPNGKLLRTSIQHMFHSQYALPRIHRSIGVTLVHGLRMERALSKRYVVQISLSRASKRPGFCFKQKDILRSKGLKLIQDMPIRYVHLLPLTRILVHRDKLPHEAIPCILGGVGDWHCRNTSLQFVLASTLFGSSRRTSTSCLHPQALLVDGVCCPLPSLE